MRPMLAMPATRVPSGPEWVHEVKWDGMRVLADVADGRVTLTSRTERDVTVAFPELAGLPNLY
jgi:bifunctional non-homologous end joining protein LigD